MDTGRDCDKAGEACQSCSDKDCAQKPEDAKLGRVLERIKHKLVVLSGKGGVGKSTVATNLAVALSLSGRQVGLLDVDVHGPSVPRLLGLAGQQPHIDMDSIEPVPWSRNLSVMSLGFLLPSPDSPVIWRGPVKMGLIRQFLQDVAWGDLDVLVVDCPPGTGDEPLSVLQQLGSDARVVIVTTPQGVAVDDVRRSVSFCRELGNPILGVVENMSGFVCPGCGSTHDIFASGGGEALARDTQVPFLGRLPIDPELGRAGDLGYSLAKVGQDSPTLKALNQILKPILDWTGETPPTAN